MKSTSNTSSETSEESTWGHLSSFQEAGVSEKNHFMSMDAIYDVGVSVLVLRLNKLNKGNCSENPKISHRSYHMILGQIRSFLDELRAFRVK